MGADIAFVNGVLKLGVLVCKAVGLFDGKGVRIANIEIVGTRVGYELF